MSNSANASNRIIAIKQPDVNSCNEKKGLANIQGRAYSLPPFGRRRSGGWQEICGLPPPQWTEFYFIMAVRIRLKRVGAKNAPYFRVVVADSRSPRDGKFIEEIGSYQPMKKGDNCKLDMDRAKYWISKGAQPSETVASFIKKLSKAAAVPA
jgi:small subunit ribosomal protein S16